MQGSCDGCHTYVIALALYSDATSQSQLLAAPERPTA